MPDEISKAEGPYGGPVYTATKLRVVNNYTKSLHVKVRINNEDDRSEDLANNGGTLEYSLSTYIQPYIGTRAYHVVDIPSGKKVQQLDLNEGASGDKINMPDSGTKFNASNSIRYADDSGETTMVDFEWGTVQTAYDLGGVDGGGNAMLVPSLSGDGTTLTIEITEGNVDPAKVTSLFVYNVDYQDLNMKIRYQDGDDLTQTLATGQYVAFAVRHIDANTTHILESNGSAIIRQLDLNNGGGSDDLNMPCSDNNSRNTVQYVAGSHTNESHDLIDFSRGSLTSPVSDSDGIDGGGRATIVTEMEGSNRIWINIRRG